MPKLALGVEYLGTEYSGWQQQRHVRTVQATLEKALGLIAGVAVRTACAGRTDAGVHATQQTVSMDLPVHRPEKAWLLGTNSHLPRDVSVHWVAEVPANFHARHSALARRYLYLILNRKLPSALLPGQLVHEPRALNVAAMHEAAQALCGEHDFSSFRAAHCQSRTPMRNVHFIRVGRLGDLVTIDIQANAFLLRMVRNIAGLLMEVGAGRQPKEKVAELLLERDRRLLGKTAPAAGLYLIQVSYPKEFGLPTEAAWPLLLQAPMAAVAVQENVISY